jgi:hypothetical protein
MTSAISAVASTFITQIVDVNNEGLSIKELKVSDSLRNSFKIARHMRNHGVSVMIINSTRRIFVDHNTAAHLSIKAPPADAREYRPDRINHNSNRSSSSLLQKFVRRLELVRYQPYGKYTLIKHLDVELPLKPKIFEKARANDLLNYHDSNMFSVVVMGSFIQNWSEVKSHDDYKTQFKRETLRLHPDHSSGNTLEFVTFRRAFNWFKGSSEKDFLHRWNDLLKLMDDFAKLTNKQKLTNVSKLLNKWCV